MNIIPPFVIWAMVITGLAGMLTLLAVKGISLRRGKSVHRSHFWLDCACWALAGTGMALLPAQLSGESEVLRLVSYAWAGLMYVMAFMAWRMAMAYDPGPAAEPETADKP